MEAYKKTNRGDGLINPDKTKEKKQSKTIPLIPDGLMEREDAKILTEDGRELLKEN